MVTELELEPKGGTIVPYGYTWEEPVEEGDFTEVFPEEPEQYVGGRWDDSDYWQMQEQIRRQERAEERHKTQREEDFIREAQEEAIGLGFEKPIDTKEKAEKFRLFQPLIEKKARENELAAQVGRAEGEARLAMWKDWKKKYAPSRFSKFLKGTGRTWKGVKEVAGPRGKLPSGFYVGKPMPGLYVPGIPKWRPTNEFMPAGEANRPHLGVLRAAGSPPPSARIKAPFRDVEKFEGLGGALTRLRTLEKLPAVDKAVYAEIKANGDVDTPSHVKSEVKRLGFSASEVNTSLKRLRNLGLIATQGKELVVI